MSFFKTPKNKLANTAFSIHDLIAQRWSPRAFQQEPITDDDLGSLFESARWAASSMNEQPWRFIFARQGEPEFDKIVGTLMDGNKPWAAKASILMLTLVKRSFSRNGNPNGSAKHDLGLAIGNLSLQATELGIGLHQMGGFSPARAKEAFDINDDFEVVTAVALGYHGDPEELDGPLQERELAERKRKPLSEIVFHKQFNNQ